LQAPAGKIARTVNAPAAQLARVFGAYGAKDAA
jgi:large subunit ribosomal protein L10